MPGQEELDDLDFALDIRDTGGDEGGGSTGIFERMAGPLSTRPVGLDAQPNVDEVIPGAELAERDENQVLVPQARPARRPDDWSQSNAVADGGEDTKLTREQISTGGNVSTRDEGESLSRRKGQTLPDEMFGGRVKGASLLSSSAHSMAGQTQESFPGVPAGLFNKRASQGPSRQSRSSESLVIAGRQVGGSSGFDDSGSGDGELDDFISDGDLSDAGFETESVKSPAKKPFPLQRMEKEESDSSPEVISSRNVVQDESWMDTLGRRHSLSILVDGGWIWTQAGVVRSWGHMMKTIGASKLPLEIKASATKAIPRITGSLVNEGNPSEGSVYRIGTRAWRVARSQQKNKVTLLGTKGEVVQSSLDDLIGKILSGEAQFLSKMADAPATSMPSEDYPARARATGKGGVTSPMTSAPEDKYTPKAETLFGQNLPAPKGPKFDRSQGLGMTDKQIDKPYFFDIKYYNAQEKALSDGEIRPKSSLNKLTAYTFLRRHASTEEVFQRYVGFFKEKAEQYKFLEPSGSSEDLFQDLVENAWMKAAKENPSEKFRPEGVSPKFDEAVKFFTKQYIQFLARQPKDVETTSIPKDKRPAEEVEEELKYLEPEDMTSLREGKELVPASLRTQGYIDIPEVAMEDGLQRLGLVVDEENGDYITSPSGINGRWYRFRLNPETGWWVQITSKNIEEAHLEFYAMNPKPNDIVLVEGIKMKLTDKDTSRPDVEAYSAIYPGVDDGSPVTVYRTAGEWKFALLTPGTTPPKPPPPEPGVEWILDPMATDPSNPYVKQIKRSLLRSRRAAMTDFVSEVASMRGQGMSEEMMAADLEAKGATPEQVQEALHGVGNGGAVSGAPETQTSTEDSPKAGPQQSAMGVKRNVRARSLASFEIPVVAGIENFKPGQRVESMMGKAYVGVVKSIGKAEGWSQGKIEVKWDRGTVPTWEDPKDLIITTDHPMFPDKAPQAAGMSKGSAVENPKEVSSLQHDIEMFEAGRPGLLELGLDAKQVDQIIAAQLAAVYEHFGVTAPAAENKRPGPGEHMIQETPVGQIEETGSPANTKSHDYQTTFDKGNENQTKGASLLPLALEANEAFDWSKKSMRGVAAFAHMEENAEGTLAAER